MFTLAMAMALLIGVFADEAMAQGGLSSFFERFESVLEGRSGEGFETGLVTSTAASQLARTSVEVAVGTPVVLTDGTATIEEGELEIELDGDVELELEGVSVDGTGFLLINQGDTDGDGDRDFVASVAFDIVGGEVDVDFGELIPFGTTVEDILITILFDTNGNGVLDAGDTILAVPGFAVTQEDDEGEDDDEAVEFEAEGTISGLTGTCPDTTFNVNGTPVTTDSNTEYENGTCDTLADGVQVEVEGVTQADGTNLAREVEFEEGEED